MKYYVVDRYRQGIDIKYLNEELSNGRLRRVFDTYADAKEYLEGCFFDDSDYCVFGLLDNGTWIRCFSETHRKVVQ